VLLLIVAFVVGLLTFPFFLTVGDSDWLKLASAAVRARWAASGSCDKRERRPDPPSSVADQQGAALPALMSTRLMTSGGYALASVGPRPTGPRGRAVAPHYRRFPVLIRRVTLAALLPALLLTGCGPDGAPPANKTAALRDQLRTLQLADVQHILVLPSGYKRIPRPAAVTESDSGLCPPESWFDASRAPVKTELFGSQSGLGPFSVQSLIVLASAARAQQAGSQFERLRPCRPVDGDGTRRTVARRAPGEYTVTASAPEMPTLTISLSVRAVGNVLYLGGDMGLGPARGLTEHDARANKVVAELTRRARRPAPTATASAR
jgi:hypothetical protein